MRVEGIRWQFLALIFCVCDPWNDQAAVLCSMRIICRSAQRQKVHGCSPIALTCIMTSMLCYEAGVADAADTPSFATG